MALSERFFGADDSIERPGSRFPERSNEVLRRKNASTDAGDSFERSGKSFPTRAIGSPRRRDTRSCRRDSFVRGGKQFPERLKAFTRAEVSWEREDGRRSRVAEPSVDRVEHGAPPGIRFAHRAIGQERLTRRFLAEDVP